MLVKELFIPGEFDEAYVYMQKLLLLNSDGELFYVDLNEVAESLDERLKPELAFISRLLFANNNPFTTPLSRAMVSNAHVRNAFAHAVAIYPASQKLGHVFVNHAGSTDAVDPLDIKVYYSRAYVGTDEGMFHIDLDIGTKKAVVGVDHSRKRHDALTAEITTNLGAINLSCLDEGLFTVFGEFGRNHSSSFYDGRLRHSGASSLRTSWLLGHVLNYEAPDRVEYKLVKTHAQKKKEDQKNVETGKNERTAFEYSSTIELMDLIHEHTGTMPLISLFNSREQLIAQTSDMELTGINVSKKAHSSRFQVNSASTIAFADSKFSRVIAVHPLRDSVIIELYGRVLLLSGSHIVPIVEGEALAVKTYPESRSSKNLATVVMEDGVYLISAFDERFIFNDENHTN